MRHGEREGRNLSFTLQSHRQFTQTARERGRGREGRNREIRAEEREGKIERRKRGKRRERLGRLPVNLCD